MATNYGSAGVKCAFYKSEADRYIRCEGIKDTTQVVLEFRTKQEKADWKEKQCNQVCPECPIREQIEKKYK